MGAHPPSIPIRSDFEWQGLWEKLQFFLMIHLEYAQNKRCYTANWTPLQKTWKPIVTSLRFDLFERILLSCPSYLKEDTRVIPVVKKKIKPVMQKSNPRMEKKNRHKTNAIPSWSLATLFGPPAARIGQKGSPQKTLLTRTALLLYYCHSYYCH